MTRIEQRRAREKARGLPCTIQRMYAVQYTLMMYHEPCYRNTVVRTAGYEYEYTTHSIIVFKCKCIYASAYIKVIYVRVRRQHCELTT